jgi:hypothetical protein
MFLYRSIGIVLSTFIFLLGCRPGNLKEYDKPYFDFDSLLNQQVERITEQRHSIRKISTMDAQQDTVNFALDSARLAHEWDVFRQLDDINKPLFKGMYKISESGDPKSNLMIRSYVAQVKSPVPFVHFYFHSKFKNLKRIESQYMEKNALYFTKRNLTLSFEKETDGNLIRHFSIEGAQKMILSDSVKFSIRGNILF